MIIKTAEYKSSYITVDKCPDVQMPEFAFIGRSNVGKSSLINYLTGRKKLSKVSVTPGKTQTINYFDINSQLHLVDLPGYGYAKVGRDSRQKWENMIRNYILKRKQLQYVCQLIDARIPPQKIDIDFINWMGENRVPFIIIFTKADKANSPDTVANVQQFKNRLLEQWDELPPIFVTSAEKKKGDKEVWEFIQQATTEFYGQKA